MVQVVDCPICGSSDFKPYSMRYRKGYPHISRVRCKSCGAVFANPMSTNSELLSFYANYYDQGGFGERDYKTYFTEQILDVLKADVTELRSPFYVVPHSGRFLDVGCGLGSSLAYASRFGLELHGTEYDLDSIAFCKKFLPEARIFHGSLIEARYANAFFDYVVFNHVIEHVTDPRLYIKESHRILKKGGTLVVATPNIGNYGHSILRFLMFLSGRIPTIVDGVEHTVVFTLPLLRRLVEEEQFLVLEHTQEGTTEAWHTILQDKTSLRNKVKRFLERIVPVNQRLICVKK